MNPNIGVPAWVVAIIAAFNVSLEAGVTAGIGYLSQWLLKSTTRVDNRVAVSATLVLCVAAYALLNHPSFAWGAQEWRVWAIAAAGWAMTALGVASLAGHTGGAPGTNSRGPGTSTK